MTFTTSMTILTPISLPQVLSRDLLHLKGLAVDWVTDNVYFSQGKETHSRIEVVSSDGLKRKVLFSDLHPTAGALAINAITG